MGSPVGVPRLGGVGVVDAPPREVALLPALGGELLEIVVCLSQG